MKPCTCIISFVCLLGLAGCSSTSLPSEARSVALVRESSNAVALNVPEFAMADGRLTLNGSLYRQADAETTTKSHIDIVFLDAAGRVLRSEVASFAPRDLRLLPRQKARGYYSVSITDWPAGTASIRVRAHETEHT